jgi:TonB family protein
MDALPAVSTGVAARHWFRNGDPCIARKRIMFQHLDRGGRGRTTAANPATFAISAVLHLIVVAGAIHFSVPPTYTPPHVPDMEEFTMISLAPMEVSTSAMQDGSPEERPVAQAPEFSEVAADRVGDVVPFEIPPVDASLSAYTSVPGSFGLGTGSSAPAPAGALVLEGIVVLAHASPFRFDYDGLEPVQPPTIRDRRAMSDLLATMYPRNLRSARISGSVTFRFVVNERGRVEPGSISLLAADREEFAIVALRVIRWFDFAPARYRGEPVPMIIELPISWIAAAR